MATSSATKTKETVDCQRRRLLLAALVTVLPGCPGLLERLRSESVVTQTAADRLTAIFPQGALEELARRRHASGASLAADLQRSARQVGVINHALSLQGKAVPRRLIQRQVAEDFAQNEVVVADGWVLSRTELTAGILLLLAEASA